MISPFEERYRTEMNEIFEEKNKFKKWMEVEVALAEVHEEMGRIPKGSASEIRKAMDKVRVERIKEIEEEIHHDLMAMVKALSEKAGKAGAYVHLGATSYDIEDTATALIFLEAISLIEKRLDEILEVLRKLAKEHKNHVCVGRTHGQHAVPTTYGLKFAIYYREFLRHKERLRAAKERISVGKMAGATGTMATFGKEGMKIQKKVMEKLGLRPAKVSNQVIQRDRHAEVLFVLSLISATLEKIAKEIRNLQRTEILEISEPFGKKQVGSSTMPHKRNPHKSERICSLSRLVRSNLLVALENIPLEHERDLTNSANERVIFPQSFIATDFMLKEMIKILKNLDFFEKNIERNLNLTKGLILAERIMIELSKRGMPRQEAHELIRKLAQKAFKEEKPFINVLEENDRVLSFISKDELKGLLDPKTYVGLAPDIVENALKD